MHTTPGADDVRDVWRGRSAEYSPGYYAYLGSNATSEAVGEALDRLIEPDAPVMEVGCSAGRHLAHLRERGYRELHGVDVNAEAFDAMADTYPELAAEVTSHAGAVGDVAPGFADRRFGAVYSVRTLQHLHPEEVGVVADLARIADVVVTVERETPGEDVETEPVEATAEAGVDATGRTHVGYVGDEIPLYYRDWAAIFRSLGLETVDSRQVRGDTLRAYRHPE